MTREREGVNHGDKENEEGARYFISLLPSISASWVESEEIEERPHGERKGMTTLFPVLRGTAGFLVAGWIYPIPSRHGSQESAKTVVLACGGNYQGLALRLPRGYLHILLARVRRKKRANDRCTPCSFNNISDLFRSQRKQEMICRPIEQDRT